MTDVARLTEAQAAQLDALYREHSKYVLRLAAAQLHNDPAAVDDLAQMVWLSVITTLVRGVTIARPLAFLAVVVRREANHHRGRAHVRRERAADWSDAVTSRALPSAAPADDDALAAGELSVPQATVLKLAAQGLNQAAIARRLGKSRQAVSQNLHNGARNLRRLAAA